MPMYLEDFQVGDTEGFGRYVVSREEVIEFAAKYDPQPFHLSDEGADGTLFGHIAASGWHTAGMTMRMIVARWGEKRVAALAGAGVDNLRWLKPVYPGDVLRAEAEVLQITANRSRDDRGIINFRITTFNQQDEPVLVQEPQVLIARRPVDG